jgi:DNA-binding IclR family transcriptional regulator
MESVRNALNVMMLMGERGAMRLVDIADELGLARSTVHRLLVTLREAGFVIQPLHSRLYTLGPTFAGLASPVVAHDDLIAAARPVLTGLRRATEETVNLLTRLGADVYYLDGVEGPRTVRVGLKNGTRIPVIASAAGLAMLAEMPIERIERVKYLSQRVRTFDEDWLAEEIETARTTGYAVSYGLAYKDVNEVGVAFRYNPGNHIAALTVAAPTQRLDPRRAQEIGVILRRAASALSAQLSRHSE